MVEPVARDRGRATLGRFLAVTVRLQQERNPIGDVDLLSFGETMQTTFDRGPMDWRFHGSGETVFPGIGYCKYARISGEVIKDEKGRPHRLREVVFVCGPRTFRGQNIWITVQLGDAWPWDKAWDVVRDRIRLVR